MLGRTECLAVASLLAAGVFAGCGGGGGGGAPSADASLQSLTVAEGVLVPVFSPEQLSYSVGPAPLAPSAQVTPTVSATGAGVIVNGVAVASGTTSTAMPLALGVTTMTIVVTAPDGATTRTYEIDFDRTSAALSSLTVSPGSLAPAFDPTTVAYNVALGIGESTATLTPTTEDPGATVTVNSEATLSGGPSAPIALGLGLTPVTIVVTARDGITQRTSIVVFKRSIAGQQGYLKASNTGAGDLFGWSVALSGDTLVVGARAEDSSATGVGGTQADNSAAESGAVYVFVRSGSAWTQQAYLKASNSGPGDEFGRTTAIAGDTVVVGAHAEDSNASGVNGSQADNSAADSGAAYVFVRSGTVWTQQAYLKASNTGSGDQFGESVAVFGDTIVVGAFAEDSNASGVNGNQADNSAADSGAAYVFVRSGTVWTQQAYLKASNTGSGDQFGSSVAISGATVAVGASAESSSATGVNGNQADNGAASSGAVYVFVRENATWAQQTYLKASNTGAGDEFGNRITLSDETLVVGAAGEDGSATGVNGDQSGNSAANSGAAYVFVRSGTIWTQQAYLKASNTGSGDQFGTSVSLSGDTLIVGAKGESSSATGIDANQADNGAVESGAAYVFSRGSSAWTQYAYVKASNTGGADQFGKCVAVQGSTVAVGADGESSEATGVDGGQASDSAASSGAVYVLR